MLQYRPIHAIRPFLTANFGGKLTQLREKIKKYSLNLANLVPNRKISLTNPATTKPPTEVPCEPTDAIANREITDICSCEMPVCWIRHIDWGACGSFVTGLNTFGICAKYENFNWKSISISKIMATTQNSNWKTYTCCAILSIVHQSTFRFVLGFSGESLDHSRNSPRESKL